MRISDWSSDVCSSDLFSQRRACRLIEVDPKTVRREATADAQAVRQRLCDLAGERRRFGYRRLGIMLAREGITMNHKKLLRLYREEGLAVRRRRGRKRATGKPALLALPQGPNPRWTDRKRTRLDSSP